MCSSDLHTADNVDLMWRVIMGLRSVNRGDDFQSIINLGDVQNHSDIAISYESSLAVQTAVSTEYSTGYVGRSISPIPNYTQILITGDLSNQYTGEFRCFFIGGKSQNSTVEASLSYRVANGMEFETNESFSIGALSSSGLAYLPMVWDLGLINIDPNKSEIGRAHV